MLSAQILRYPCWRKPTPSCIRNAVRASRSCPETAHGAPTVASTLASASCATSPFEDCYIGAPFAHTVSEWWRRGQMIMIQCVCMYLCMCVCVWICVYVCMHACMCTYAHMYVFFVCMYIYTYAYMFVQIFLQWMLIKSGYSCFQEGIWAVWRNGFRKA